MIVPSSYRTDGTVRPIETNANRAVNPPLSRVLVEILRPHHPQDADTRIRNEVSKKAVCKLERSADKADQDGRDRVPEHVDDQDVDGEGRGPDFGAGDVRQHRVRRAGVEEEGEDGDEQNTQAYGNGAYKKPRKNGKPTNMPHPATWK